MAGSPLGMEGAQENSAVVVSGIWAGSGPDLGQGLREGGHGGLGRCIQPLYQGPGPVWARWWEAAVCWAPALDLPSSWAHWKP